MYQPWPFNSVLLDAEKLMAHHVTDTSDFTTRLLVTILKVINILAPQRERERDVCKECVCDLGSSSIEA